MTDKILGELMSEREVAMEIDTCDPRTTRKFLDGLGLSYVIVKRERFYSRVAIKEAIVAKMTTATPAPRGRGRPRIGERHAA